MSSPAADHPGGSASFRAETAADSAASAAKNAGVAKDLEYLFGEKAEPTDVEKLERKFWALMRIMARKGLITKDEFRDELDEGDE